MKKVIIVFLLICVGLVIPGCKSKKEKYFKLWNECDALSALKEYVEDVLKDLFREERKVVSIVNPLEKEELN